MQTISGGNPTQTGDLFRITIKDGFLCLNQQVATYKEKLCSDYKVRYCCLKSSIGQTVTISTPPSLTTIPTTTTPSITNVNNCGRQSIPPTSQRIVGGVEAIPNSWPWQLLLVDFTAEGLPYSYCGASLITPKHVLTAAHCV